MKIIKNILKFIGLSLLLLVVGSAIYIYSSGPSLPKGSNEIIEKVLESPLPELVRGKTGFAQSQGLNIWYEHSAPPDSSRGAVLLIMGISNDALAWPEAFIKAFVDSGYQVIRYDHRGTGLSDWVADWDPEQPYSLADMAKDGIAVLNTLGIPKAHIIGVSMGGMIAQELALKHPNRCVSLTSIMSSGNIVDPELAPISSAVAWQLIRTSLKYGLLGNVKNSIKLHLASRVILRGNATYELNIKEIAEQVLYNTRRRRGYNSKVSQQHQAAVFLSGSRYAELENLAIPTLVIHGKSDPFIPIAHSKKYVALISQSDSLWLDNMGHDLPNYLVDPIVAKIMAHFKRGINEAE